jgi:uncharacterized membrane protein
MQTEFPWNILQISIHIDTRLQVLTLTCLTVTSYVTIVTLNDNPNYAGYHEVE